MKKLSAHLAIMITLMNTALAFEATIKDKNLMISDKGTRSRSVVAKANMIPRGSALLTPSGELAYQGITNIIHAAPGAMSRSEKDFEPTLKGLKLSLKNSLRIADKMKLECLAVPFIGGGIFLNSFKMTKAELAEAIVRTVVKFKADAVTTFVAYGAEDTEIFKKVLTKYSTNPRVKLVSGSITDFNLHKCPTIVNAANMEVQFGGGISGVIGRATGKSDEIDAIAAEMISRYNLAH
jgi:O-acetyl-ADP-ribose deacetylase (regulator of RNase III)